MKKEATGGQMLGSQQRIYLKANTLPPDGHLLHTTKTFTDFALMFISSAIHCLSSHCCCLFLYSIQHSISSTVSTALCPWWQCWVSITHSDRNPWNPVCETHCKCIFGEYQLLINAVVSQHADRSILSLELTSWKNSSDKELIKGGKRWIWFWGSVSNWAHERYWRGAGAGTALPY